YSQAAGGMPIVLDLKSGDKANFSMSGEDLACTYKVNEDKLALDCSPNGEKLDFTIHDDGSLTGPGMVGILKKGKIATTNKIVRCVFYAAACFVALAAMAFGLPGCGKSDSGGGTSGGSKQASGMERAAQDAALAEVKKH